MRICPNCGNCRNRGAWCVCVQVIRNNCGLRVASPVWQNYTCQQLSMEVQAVSARAAAVAGAQDQKRSNDAIATGVAVVVFWPAAFLVGGDGPTAAELGQLKGQMIAIEQASNMKRCGIQFQGQRPPGA